MSELKNLKPGPVWHYFSEICRVPRLSKNEERIRKYLLDFAKGNNLEHREDSTGNILIVRKPAQGKEKLKTVVLQSHMDMVGEKNADHPHNWMNDPIIPHADEEWVYASGTTLGADDGIGMAAQMAILTDENLKTGKIECLFTVDEESGMTGAVNLSPDFFEGRILINLDSEDEGILFIGCAGGMDTIGTLKISRVPSNKDHAAVSIILTGLHGGHSGDEIHKGYGNSVKIMTRILRELSKNFGYHLASFEGGNLRNAIPREAFVTITAEKAKVRELIIWIEDYFRIIRDEFGAIEKEISLLIKEAPVPENVIADDDASKLLSALTCCPHGTIAWSKDMEDLVETSTNLASVKLENDNTIIIVTTQRSSVESSKRDVGSMVEACLKLAGAEVTHSDGYPGWKPDLKSDILRITKDSYIRLFGMEPLVRAIHAGLECGIINEKVKGIDMISFGPTIRGAHTPEEKIEIATVQMFWDLLTDILENIPEQKS